MPRWVLVDWKHSKYPNRVYFDINSTEGLRAIAKYYSESYKHFKEPGPAWYRLIMTERPQRRHAKNELRKFMLNEEYEVILNDKDPLEYWT